MRPDDYDTRAGCHSCYHMFRRTEHDDWPEYYCTLGDKEERPLCGSVAMNESFFLSCRSEMAKTRKRKRADSFDEFYAAWEAWAAPRKVEAWGFCDAWEGA
jgi:hypothetical protein